MLDFAWALEMLCVHAGHVSSTHSLEIFQIELWMLRNFVTRYSLCLCS